LIPEGDGLIGENGILLGIVFGSDLDDALAKGTGGAAVVSVVRGEVLKKLPHLHPDEPADIVLHRLGQFGLSILQRRNLGSTARHEHKDGSTGPPGPVAVKLCPVSTSGLPVTSPQQQWQLEPILIIRKSTLGTYLHVEALR
jgi:hypothetical protein